MKKYFPIFLSKKGELVALQHLVHNVKDEISPVIEVLNESICKTDKESNVVYLDSLQKYFVTHWSFFGNQVILDFSCFFEPDSRMDVIKKLLHNLLVSGVNVVPAIQQNSPENYFDLVKELISTYNCAVCIRTSNQSGGFLDFGQQINNLLLKLEVTPDNVILLLDMGQVQDSDHNMMATIAGMSIQQLTQPVNKWKDVVVASSSFPENLTKLDPSATPHKLKRYEWAMWQSMNKVQSLKGIKYSDYGTKSAAFSDVKFAGTVSLKYTAKDNFIIYRGELTDSHIDGHGQYISHALKLTQSSDFSGSGFSWGDLTLDEISKQDLSNPNKKTGNPTNWVQNSQNHHVTLLHSIL